METLDFPYFVEKTKYDDQDRSVKLGGGHSYQIEPAVLDPRIFSLTYSVLIWFVDDDGKVDYVTDPEMNAGRLDAFYNRHRLHKPFLFDHPKFGKLKVRFKTALAMSEPSRNGGGAVTNVKVELLEML